MRIQNSSAIVVGGASGLGEATVRALHGNGADVTIADVNAEKGQALASDLGLEFVACDVREESQVEAAVQQAANTGEGGLRIAVCCAGTGWAQKLAGSKGPHPLMPFETILQINLIGTFNVLRYAATAMIANDPAEDNERGVLVTTASIAAYDGQVGQIAYSASKGGIIGMTVPAARDLSVIGVRVNTICPGVIFTPIYKSIAGQDADEFLARLAAPVVFPKRLGRADEFGQLVRSLIENDYMNAEVVRFDGGIRFQPK